MLILIQNAFMCALIGFVYSYMLTEPDQLFSGWYNWLSKKLNVGNECNPKMHWTFYPIIGCTWCVCGQIALWHYILTSKWYTFSFFDLCFQATFSVFISAVLIKVYKKYIRI